ncbi:uncharacterized protein LOC109712161 [Ananas comosus]|uniref:Uncharacterized protein LOC109712161 n=1 Tax=Ananas comosus TaxID=4615 RepID=A0A6P5F5B1_ANACO|nr:uncharacterized protein LOC109712161 [Ananas comosus]
MEWRMIDGGCTGEAIECVAGSSRAEEWGGGETPQTGDVVEEITIGAAAVMRAPFKGGRGGVEKLLHAAYKRGNACIVPSGPLGRRRYVLRSIHDPNYAVAFVDRSEGECLVLQGSRSSRIAFALSKAQLQDGYVSYPWEKKMKEALPIPESSRFLSMLILPKALDATASRYSSLEDTLARAEAWLLSSQASGVPVVFINVQTEALLTKISGEAASATVNSRSIGDLVNLANASLYGFEDYHGVDIGVVKAVRLWYTAAAGELPVEITLQEGDTRLGFSISRTEEGFIYISSVVEDDQDNETPSTRSGLRDLYREAKSASKLLVISRVSNQKMLPWMASSSGGIRCFDTVSLSKKLSLHRHALQPILIHVLKWERPVELSGPMVLPPSAQVLPPSVLDEIPPILVSSADSEATLERDTAGDASFRFHDFTLPNNWV